jgi:alpha-galactosidase
MKTRHSTKLMTLFLAFILHSNISAQEFAKTEPEKVGKSSERLEYLTSTFQELPFRRVLDGPITDYEFMRASGRHAREYILNSFPLQPSGLEIKCESGRSSKLDKPWLALRNRKTTQGLTIFLAYPGNWQIQVRPLGTDKTELLASTLPNKLPTIETVNSLKVPGVIAADFTGHWDNGANEIKRFIRSKLLRKHGDDWPLVQYNTWFDTGDELDEGRMMESARRAAQIGCELFVVDAGWYGRNNNWHLALGDWRPNPKKLPKGTKPLANLVHSLGMKFGMWVEIECAHPESPVAQEHPDWIFRVDGELVSRRMVLDYSNPEVLAWAKSEIDRIVVEHQIDYMKMDFNSDLMIEGDRNQQVSKRLWAYYRGVTKLWNYIRATHPDLIVENCSSGSLRADASASAYSDLHWVSDNIDPHYSLAANYGATYLFPPEYCLHWTVWPKTSPQVDMQSTFNMSMLGVFGVSGPIVLWGNKTLDTAADRIALYKMIRPWIKKSDVYHLTDQANFQSPSTIQAVQYVGRSNDRSILFAFHGGDSRTQTSFKLKGLNPANKYFVKIPPTFGTDLLKTGAELAQGLQVKFPHAGSSAVIRIQPVYKSMELPKVTGLTAKPANMLNARHPSALTLSWDEIPGAQRYLISLGKKGQPLRLIDETFVTSYLATNLEPETEYDILVLTEFGEGASNMPPVVTAKTRSLCVDGPKLWLQHWTNGLSWDDSVNWAEKYYGARPTKRMPYFLNIQKTEATQNSNIIGFPLAINGKHYDAGIGTRAPSKLIFDVSKIPADKRKTFSATIGLDDYAEEVKEIKPAVVFRIMADEKEIYRSDVFSSDSKPQEINISLPPTAKKLILIVDPAGQNKSNDYLYANWIKPLLR